MCYYYLLAGRRSHADGPSGDAHNRVPKRKRLNAEPCHSCCCYSKSRKKKKKEKITHMARSPLSHTYHHATQVRSHLCRSGCLSLPAGVISLQIHRAGERSRGIYIYLSLPSISRNSDISLSHNPPSLPPPGRERKRKFSRLRFMIQSDKTSVSPPSPPSPLLPPPSAPCQVYTTICSNGNQCRSGVLETDSDC